MANRQVMAKANLAAGVDARSGARRARFDKWLWAARFYKTRSLAAQAIDAGQARLSGARVKPAHAVRAGDAVAIRKQGIEWTVEVTALSDQRGNAVAAAKLYRETEASIKAREDVMFRRRGADAAQPRFPGRPTKRQRRKLEDLLNEP
jgi:ribosome-associated heat shock protein Hsp15